MKSLLQHIYRILSPEHQLYLKVLQTQTSFYPKLKLGSPKIVCALDSKAYNCGFADRLRGMISGYAIAKANNIPFGIIHKEPFELHDFLVPNKYDWRTIGENSSINYWDTKISISLNNIKEITLLKTNVRKRVFLFCNNDLIRQVNKSYHKDYSYRVLFEELFKPSKELQKHIDQIKEKLSDDYVSVSFRFMNLIGDKFEGDQQPLTKDKRDYLIRECISRIYKIHDENDKSKILVTADSMIFLELIKNIPFVCIIPGKTGHSGHKENGAKDITMKTFLDFIMISNAKKAYLVKGPDMFNSHFASSAAQTTGIPFERITFE